MKLGRYAGGGKSEKADDSLLVFKMVVFITEGSKGPSGSSPSGLYCHKPPYLELLSKQVTLRPFSRQIFVDTRPLSGWKVVVVVVGPIEAGVN